MMIRRKTVRTPGWDCITGKCPRPGGSTSGGIFTHTQRPRDSSGVIDCPYVGRCNSDCVTTLGGVELWDRHKTPDQEATEALWIELEEWLTKLVTTGIDV